MTQAQAIEILNRYLATAQLILRKLGDLQVNRADEPAQFDAINEAWKTIGGSGLLLSSGRLTSSVVEELSRAGFPRTVTQATSVTSSKFNTTAALVGAVAGWVIGGPIGAATAGASAGLLFRR